MTQIYPITGKHMTSSRLLGPLLLAAIVASCQSTTAPSAPPGAGSTTTVTRSPDKEKWLSRRDPSNATIYTCRPLACPSPTAVRVSTTRSPTRSIDPAALEQFAKTTVPANIKAANTQIDAASGGYRNVTMVSSKTTKIRDFPAVVVETKRAGDGPPKSGFRIYLFAGYSLIITDAISDSREIAQKTAMEFVQAYDISDDPGS
jgi:hypothetical protein